MIEIRFIQPYKECRVIKNTQTGETATYYDTEDGLMLLKWLNNLSEENEQLKKEDELFFGKVFDILLKYQDLFNREMADEVLEELGIELTKWFE